MTLHYQMAGETASQEGMGALSGTLEVQFGVVHLHPSKRTTDAASTPQKQAFTMPPESIHSNWEMASKSGCLFAKTDTT